MGKLIKKQSIIRVRDNGFWGEEWFYIVKNDAELFKVAFRRLREILDPDDNSVYPGKNPTDIPHKLIEEITNKYPEVKEKLEPSAQDLVLGREWARKTEWWTAAKKALKEKDGPAAYGLLTRCVNSDYTIEILPVMKV